MIRDISPELRETIGKKLAEHILNEDVWFDFGMTMVMTENGPSIGYQLVVSTRSPLLSPRWIAGSALIADGHPGEQQIEFAIGQCTEQLAELRKRLLSSVN